MDTEQRRLLLLTMVVVTGSKYNTIQYDGGCDATSKQTATTNLLPRNLRIGYTQCTWTLSSAGLGDIECREYLRFTRAEIARLVLHFGLDTEGFWLIIFASFVHTLLSNTQIQHLYHV